MSVHSAGELPIAAETILESVDDAQIFKSETTRQFPTFFRSELGLGPVLGIGGFSVVKEISATRLKETFVQEDAVSGSEDKCNLGDEDDHLDVSIAREFIASNCLRNKDARYAFKQLRKDLPSCEIPRGMVDLAIEIKFLSVFSHPNIIKMRGVANGGVLGKGNFIILDRLYGTLVEKMDEWAVRKKLFKGFWGFGEKKTGLKEQFVEQLTTIYDISSAFRYMHDKNLVYRDIKPENVGFDVRGDVKVFDFGLCKDLNPSLKARMPGTYNLTGLTGTHPYMAPEVALHRPYGQSADVYSFAILMWEILSLKIPFEGVLKDRTKFERNVLVNSQRPAIQKIWPPFTSNLLEDSWDVNPGNRPNFERINAVIYGDLSSMTEEAAILNRTSHMMERSRRSIHGKSFRR